MNDVDSVAYAQHHLRTPLTSIIGFAYTVAAHWDKLSEQQRKDYVERVHSHAIDLRAVIDLALEGAENENEETALLHFKVGVLEC